MTEAPVLAMPDFNQPFIVETDASDKGLGAVLMQGRNPVAFLSKSLGTRAQGLSTYEKELLALITAVQKWRHYLSNKPFIIRTDQVSLKYLLEQRLTSSMQHKGLCKLLGLDYSIEYKRGIANKVADALSRTNCEENPIEAQVAAISELLPQWLTELKESYLNDEWIQSLQEKVKLEPDKYSEHQGIIRYKGRICVGSSQDWRQKLMHEMHDSPTGGHSGIQGTYQRIKRTFYWPNLKQSVHEHVSTCEICQMTKGEHVKSLGLLQPLPIPDQAWSSVSMDFISGLPVSEGKSVILVVVDRLTKYAHFFALSHPYNASQVAQVFLDGIHKLHGLPTTIVTDRDPVFTSLFWKELMGKLNVKLNFTTAYHPQSDGQTERVNQCLETYLRCMVYCQPKHWIRWLSAAEWWYNTNFHSSLKITPFEALYSYVPPHLSLGSPPKCAVASVEEKLKERHQTVMELKKQLLRAQERMKRFADQHRSERRFQTGDWVYLKMQPYRQVSVKGKGNHKLRLKYYGPFEVIQKIGSVAYKLKLPESSLIHPVFHVSQLKGRVGNTQAVSPNLPVINPEGKVRDIPEAILERRVVKRGNAAAVQVLVKWSNGPVEDATWEDYSQIENSYPEFVLRDKDQFKRGRLSAIQLDLGATVGERFELVKDAGRMKDQTVQLGMGPVVSGKELTDPSDFKEEVAASQTEGAELEKIAVGDAVNV